MGVIKAYQLGLQALGITKRKVHSPTIADTQSLEF
jgi:hypothetical protein